MSAMPAVGDPGVWLAAALEWRRRAAAAGQWAERIGSAAERLRPLWAGACAEAVAAALLGIVRRLTLFRLGCWAADQALSEFAAALARARRTGDHRVAASADRAAGDRLGGLFHRAAAASVTTPPCPAAPAEVRRWWETLGPAQRDWLTATAPGAVGALDGVPAAARDRANRLLLDGLTVPESLAARLGDERGPRAYLLRVDPGGDGRAVVALGDPDRAAAVLTQVPGMTADLASYGGELARADRLAVRAAELAPERPASTIMWLGYDAPDGLGEAVSRSWARAGAGQLRRFQEGLRAAHEGEPARQTVLGHSYGSLVVGTAAAAPGLDADGVVFVGSPGTGVDRAAELAVPAAEVWAMTSLSDPIQWAAVSPRSLAGDVLLGRIVPGGAPAAFLRPEEDLFFGANPAGPAFGARTVASQPDAGHLGYWDEGRPALDALARIATGSGDVTPR